MQLSSKRFQMSMCFALILVILMPAVLRGESRKKVGLVLSGGGARGIAHIGVLKVLERENIPIDYIAGTSFGALVGGLYALGYSAAEIEEIFTQQDWNRYFNDAPERRLTPFPERKNAGYQVQLSFNKWIPELPSGLWEGQQLRETLDKLTTLPMLEAQYDFDRLPIPFCAVATDLVEFKPYFFRQGSMSEALRASMAIPVIFTPVEKDGKLLVDGGLTDNLPTDIVRQMGADIVIAVDVSSPLLKKNEIRNLVDVSDQTTTSSIQKNMEANKHLADFILKPDLDGFSTYDFSQISKILGRGEKEAEAHVKDINEALEVAGLPRRSRPAFRGISESKVRIIDSIVFEGLKNVSTRQAKREIRVRPGKPLSLPVLISDMRRLYATHLFDSVEYYLEPVAENRYRLKFNVKEAATVTLDAGIRYGNDYKFVALGQITAHQLFNSPTRLTLASRFGGYEDHSATLRYTPSYLPFLFVDTEAFARRLERHDIRNGEFFDDYTVRRLGGQVMFGGTFFKQLEVAVGYRLENVRIIGGAADRKRPDSNVGGFFLRFSHDSLDDREFPSKGMVLGLQANAMYRRFGGDFDYFKVKLESEKYFSISKQNTLGINFLAGFAESDAPYYEGFYLGGYSFSQLGSYPLLGYDRDEILTDETAILGVQYRRRIYDASLGFVKNAYLTTFFNGGADGFLGGHGVHGAGIGLALNTILGPIRVTGGFGKGGRTNFYFTFGPEF